MSLIQIVAQNCNSVSDDELSSVHGCTPCLMPRVFGEQARDFTQSLVDFRLDQPRRDRGLK
jgi:hypothetical protein